MEADDYESLPQNTPVSTHMVAGAAAGVMEHCIMYPVDCVKTRMQCLVPNPRANYRGVADALYQIVRYEGLRNTVRGISAVVGGAGPAHAMYFACYEHIKFKLSGTKQGNPLANGAAGVAATLLHDAVMNPAEVVKQRMQMFGSPYSSCYECGRKIAQVEGAKAFYRSYVTQLTMNIPFQTIHFITYELMQDVTNKSRDYDPKSHMISGAIAGAASAGITTPLDVCKTLLNTQEKSVLQEGQIAITGMSQAVRTIYRLQGLSGFFKGFHARVIYQMPATGVTWSVYEFFKYFITKKRTDDGYVSASSAGVSPVPPLHAVHAKTS